MINSVAESISEILNLRFNLKTRRSIDFQDTSFFNKEDLLNVDMSGHEINFNENCITEPKKNTNILQAFNEYINPNAQLQSKINTPHVNVEANRVNSDQNQKFGKRLPKEITIILSEW